MNESLMQVDHIPFINAVLNTTSALFLGLAFSFIRLKQPRYHRICIVSALISSTLFLGLYLAYHYHVGHVSFKGPMQFSWVYKFILATHSVIAVLTLPLITLSIVWAHKKKFLQHRKWARLTMGLWFYVSVTGVAIYRILY